MFCSVKVRFSGTTIIFVTVLLFTVKPWVVFCDQIKYMHCSHSVIKPSTFDDVSFTGQKIDIFFQQSE